MGRLTEREAYWIGEEFWLHAKDPDYEEVDAVYEKLRDYENAEEDGLLVRLPCKVGDIVYVIRESWNGYNIDRKKFSYAMIGKFGKTVFLTKEAAQERLKEVQNE